MANCNDVRWYSVPETVSLDSPPQIDTPSEFITRSLVVFRKTGRLDSVELSNQAKLLNETGSALFPYSKGGRFFKRDSIPDKQKPLVIVGELDTQIGLDSFDVAYSAWGK
jgi:hypothetical protein